MDEGAYMLVSGSRMASGGVLAQVQFFTLKPVRRRRFLWSCVKIRRGGCDRQFQQRKQISDHRWKGDNILLNHRSRLFHRGHPRRQSEPTNHAPPHDIAAVKQKLKLWGRPIVLLPRSERFQCIQSERIHLHFPRRSATASMPTIPSNRNWWRTCGFLHRTVIRSSSSATPSTASSLQPRLHYRAWRTADENIHQRLVTSRIDWNKKSTEKSPVCFLCFAFALKSLS